MHALLSELTRMEANLDAAIRSSYGGLRSDTNQLKEDVFELRQRLDNLHNEVMAMRRREEVRHGK